MGVNAFGHRLWGVWPLQAVGGGLVLAIWAWSGNTVWFEWWQELNLLIVGAVIAVLALRLWQHPAIRSWGIFGLSLVLLLSGLAGVLMHGPSPPILSAGVYTYPAGLVCLWWLLSERFSNRQLSVLASPPASDQDHRVRQRMAQDVHDGVGSHLVSILSSLDLQDPLQKTLALSLEQCLLDLKITVDSMHDDLHSLTDALAMLRYRMQPCLERSGAVLRWELEPHPALDCLPVNTVVQCLRIVQECMANVMLHARATELVLDCRYQEASNSIHLSVRDNGLGFHPPTPAAVLRGKGLNGMRRRAAELGASLGIVSRPGHGTLVTLAIPCPDR
jgi:two-component sensor histidine kinase